MARQQRHERSEVAAALDDVLGSATGLTLDGVEVIEGTVLSASATVAARSLAAPEHWDLENAVVRADAVTWEPVDAADLEQNEWTCTCSAVLVTLTRTNGRKLARLWGHRSGAQIWVPGLTPEVLADGQLTDLETLRALAVTGVSQETLSAPPPHGHGAARKYTVTPVSLTLDADITLDEWREQVRRLRLIGSGIPWWLADALAQGEARFHELASQALDTDQWAGQTLLNVAYTARHVPVENRRSTISFSHYSELAPLAPDVQRVWLDRIEEAGWTRNELRQALREAKRADARAAALAAADPGSDTGGRIEVHVGDARAVPLADASIDLLVESPPYALDKSYERTNGAADWEVFIADAADEAYRILRQGGRWALNVPLDTTRPTPRPTLAQATTALVGAGFSYRATIIWNEGSISKSVARGSIDSPSAPHIMARSEAIILASKGPWKLAAPVDGGRGTTDLTHEDWLAWTDGTWAIPGESNPWEGFDAAMPVELAVRVLRLLSWREGIICDRFAGSGTTLVAAHRTGRRAYGFDRDSGAVASCRRRLLTVSGMASGRAR